MILHNDSCYRLYIHFNKIAVNRLTRFIKNGKSFILLLQMQNHLMQLQNWLLKIQN